MLNNEGGSIPVNTHGGQLSEAIRLVYLSALYALDERALLHVERGLTNREHAGLLRSAHPTLGALFSDVVSSYDMLRYGRDSVTRENFNELSALAAHARDAALQGTTS